MGAILIKITTLLSLLATLLSPGRETLTQLPPPPAVNVCADNLLCMSSEYLQDPVILHYLCLCHHQLSYDIYQTPTGACGSQTLSTLLGQDNFAGAPEDLPSILPPSVTF